MSYDLAVWEGPQPASDAEAATTCETLYGRYVAGNDNTVPTERIAAYVRALLVKYPDLTELDDESVDDSPWADGPLIGNATGPFFYFSFVTSAAHSEAWKFAVSTAREHGLIAFDPQADALAAMT